MRVNGRLTSIICRAQHEDESRASMLHHMFSLQTLNISSFVEKYKSVAWARRFGTAQTTETNPDMHARFTPNLRRKPSSVMRCCCFTVLTTRRVMMMRLRCQRAQTMLRRSPTSSPAPSVSTSTDKAEEVTASSPRPIRCQRA